MSQKKYKLFIMLPIYFDASDAFQQLLERSQTLAH